MVGAHPRTLLAFCFRLIAPHPEVPELACQPAPGEKFSACRGTSCEWQAGPWSECDIHCGVGNRTRNVWCQGAEGECIGEKLPVAEECQDYSACTFLVGEWGECSSSCGSGTRTREVACTNADGQPLDDSICLQNTAVVGVPPTEQVPLQRSGRVAGDYLCAYIMAAMQNPEPDLRLSKLRNLTLCGLRRDRASLHHASRADTIWWLDCSPLLATTNCRPRSFPTGASNAFVCHYPLRSAQAAPTAPVCCHSCGRTWLPASDCQAV